MRWVKVDVDMPTHPNLVGRKVWERHLWTCLLCTTKKHFAEDGIIRGLEPRVLAASFNLGVSGAHVKTALDYFAVVGMVELGPGTIRVVDFLERQAPPPSESRDAWRDRKRKQREDGRDMPVTPEDVTAGQSELSRRSPGRDSHAEIDREEDQDQDPPVVPQGGQIALPTDTSPAEHVFQHWQRVMGHPRAYFDKVRRRRVEAQLREGRTVADLQLAIEGCRASPMHMGANEDRTRYDDLALVCRDAKHVEGFMRIGKRPPVPLGPDGVAVLQVRPGRSTTATGYVPPETDPEVWAKEASKNGQPRGPA